MIEKSKIKKGLPVITLVRGSRVQGTIEKTGPKLARVLLDEPFAYPDGFKVHAVLRSANELFEVK